MTTVLLSALALWLLLLTVLVSVLFTVVSAREERAADSEGEETPRRYLNGPLPAAVAAAFKRLGMGTELSAAAFTAGDEPSLHQARLIKPAEIAVDRTVFLVTGGDGADPVEQVLAETGVKVIRDPEAGEILRALDAVTPLAIEISGGQVVAQHDLGRDGTFGRFATLVRERRGRARIR
ncbi:hypothetical protein [Amycolatopsis sp. NPDC054798]